MFLKTHGHDGSEMPSPLMAWWVSVLFGAAGLGLVVWSVFAWFETVTTPSSAVKPSAGPSAFAVPAEPVVRSAGGASAVIQRAAAPAGALRPVAPSRNSTEVRPTPEMLGAEHKDLLDGYDTRLAERGAAVPAWWGNRNIQADIAAVDPQALVTRVSCFDALCAVDVVYQDTPAEGVIDERLLNQPAMQGGLLIRRDERDAKRMRLYIFGAEMESRPLDVGIRPF
jgi:hypothetical protein